MPEGEQVHVPLGLHRQTDLDATFRQAVIEALARVDPAPFIEQMLKGAK